MNSPSILDLERLSLAESQTLHPLPSPDSSPAPTLCSLPPELVSHIFDCTLTLLSSKATLASLCRVNLYFLEIARPLLYHHIHLNPSIDRNKHSSRYSQLVDTVLFAKHCADLVRSIEITVEADRTELDWTLLRCVLGRCKRLKKFSTGWREWKGSKADQDRLIEAISEEATSIEHLELPYIPLELSATMRLVSALGHLRTLLFVPVYTSPQIVPLFSLQKVVWQSRMVNRALGIYLSSSRYTLTSLSFQFNYAKPPMLDMFPNLSTLRLILDGFRTIENSNNASTRTPDEDCLDAVRATLLSTRSLPVKHLTISTKLFVTAESVADYCMLDCLPPTIVSFTGVPQFFGILNLPSLVRLSRTAGTPSYPDLRRLTIAPPLFTASVDGETHKLMDTTSRRVSKVLASNGVDVIVDLGAKLGEQFGWVEACPV